MAWDPQRYERYRDERARPFHDLLALVQAVPGMRVVDLGCGTGELTRRLHDHVRASRTLGLDRSAEMLAASDAHRAPGLRFERRTIEAFADEPRGTWDLVCSNAALHWVADHAALFPKLARCLAPRGQLAAQMPLSQDDEAHHVAVEVASEPPFRARSPDPEPYPRPLLPEAYRALLAEVGFADLAVEVREYVSLLRERDEVVDWYRGSLLTAYEERLGPLFPTFLEAFRKRLLPRLPDQRPFPFRMRRLLLWGRR